MTSADRTTGRTSDRTASSTASSISGRVSRGDTRRVSLSISCRLAAAGIAAALASGGFGALVIAQPAHAATTPATDIETTVDNGNIQGKAGAKTAVGFEVSNRGDIKVAVGITIRVPGNTQIESAGDCTVVGGNRTAATCTKALDAKQSFKGSIQVVLRTAGEGNGGVDARITTQKVNDSKPGNNAAQFKIRVTGASATPSASKSTRASRSASADPAATSDEIIAPPEAGNGAIPRDDPKTTVSKDSGGLSFGFWIGVVAIVAALGLVGSLFYFRRKDRLEPDTGVFNLPAAGHDQATSVITPGVYGSPAAPAGAAFQGGQGYGQGFPPGQGAPGGPNVYGGPPAAPPAGPPAAGFPPAGGPPAPAPGANDQTIIMRRPDDL
ncbi:hypothetical protein ACFO1B_36780 [Dactylosporangium siamense]|uniref:hypothetical protein n=1 Tax=Dactylosporangium siamense TaxID=685454 RepID=UPI001940C7D7|nr:hypothetical protein [Dactylosporangium siamense]